jgi:hypothetical protein
MKNICTTTLCISLILSLAIQSAEKSRKRKNSVYKPLPRELQIHSIKKCTPTHEAPNDYDWLYTDWARKEDLLTPPPLDAPRSDTQQYDNYEPTIYDPYGTNYESLEYAERIFAHIQEELAANQPKTNIETHAIGAFVVPIKRPTNKSLEDPKHRDN